MRTIKLTSAAAVILFCMTIPSRSAQLVSVDGWVAGDREIVLDQFTNLQWLRLTVTNNVSIASFNAGYGSLIDDGFQLATGDQVATLFGDAGAPEPILGNEKNVPGSETAVKLLGNLLGCTTCQNLHPDLNASLFWYGEGKLRIGAGYGFGYYQYYAIPDNDPATLTGTSPVAQGISETQSQLGSGLWLFRTAPSTEALLLGTDPTPVFPTAVPEPATWAMMLIGFGGIGFMMRASRRKGAVATA
jgi:hypothetical protein